jgi:hypothetical protein
MSDGWRTMTALIQAPPNRLQRTALRAAAEPERYAHLRTLRDDDSVTTGTQPLSVAMAA